MAEYMTPEREEYIAKLEGQIQAIDSILKMDSGTVVSAELRKQLKALKSEAETVLRKLRNNEFEIAIVGLEKAGKSTFANALMENNLLPTKDLRCTFTSTITIREDAHGFCKEICRFQRPKSGAVNDKTKIVLSFTIHVITYNKKRLPPLL